MIRGSDEVTYLKANGLDNILAAIATKSCPRGVDYFNAGLGRPRPVDHFFYRFALWSLNVSSTLPAQTRGRIRLSPKQTLLLVIFIIAILL